MQLLLHNLPQSCVREYYSALRAVLAILYIHSIYAMSVDDGNLTSMCMRVVAFLATPSFPHSPRMNARAPSASTRLFGNDLSHARNLGVPECAKCTKQARKRERERAVDDEFSVPGTCHIAQFIFYIDICGMLPVFSYCC